jgi:hypothetical protein
VSPRLLTPLHLEILVYKGIYPEKIYHVVAFGLENYRTSPTFQLWNTYFRQYRDERKSNIF